MIIFTFRTFLELVLIFLGTSLGWKYPGLRSNGLFHPSSLFRGQTWSPKSGKKDRLEYEVYGCTTTNSSTVDRGKMRRRDEGIRTSLKLRRKKDETETVLELFLLVTTTLAYKYAETHVYYVGGRYDNLHAGAMSFRPSRIRDMRRKPFAFAHRTREWVTQAILSCVPIYSVVVTLLLRCGCGRRSA